MVGVLVEIVRVGMPWKQWKKIRLSFRAANAGSSVSAFGNDQRMNWAT